MQGVKNLSRINMGVGSSNLFLTNPYQILVYHSVVTFERTQESSHFSYFHELTESREIHSTNGKNGLQKYVFLVLFSYTEVNIIENQTFGNENQRSALITDLGQITKNDLYLRAALGAQAVKNSPAMQKTQIPSLGWEDSLEKGMAPHSSILAWIIPLTKEPGRLQFTVFQSQTLASD